MTAADNTPIIVGVGQKTWRQVDAARSPIDAHTEASSLALRDTGSKHIAAAIDAVATVRFIGDTDPGIAALLPRHPGKHVAQRLGIADATYYQGIIGGNTPQYLVNHFASSLAQGDHNAVMLSGAELLATLFSALGSGADISTWAGKGKDEPATLGHERDGLNETEKLYSLYEPINTYPLFENSLRHHLGCTAEEHQAFIARICSSMSEVASENPHAWKPETLTAEQVASVGPRNRYIGYPYTKAMNPILAVDMAAAVIMTTVGKARELGIDASQWIYLRSGVDLNDCWYVSQRPALHESPAIRMAWDSISRASGISVDDLTDLDIYSCFPSAVQVACNEIGISPLDTRGVTVTGGLPYMGGPGNNYSLHAIAQMVARLRTRDTGHGLVTANGLYLTKHSLGLYSTEPGDTGWEPVNSNSLQQQIDALPTVDLAEDPTGDVVVETFTVIFDRDGPRSGIIVARNERGERVLAKTAANPDILERLLSEDPIGQTGQVHIRDGENQFEFTPGSSGNLP